MAGLIPPERLQGLVKDVFSKAPKTYTSFSSTLTTLKSIAMAGSRAAVESGIQAASRWARASPPASSSVPASPR